MGWPLRALPEAEKRKTNNKGPGARHHGEKNKGTQNIKSTLTITRGAVWTAPVELAALAGTILAGAVAWI